MTGVWSHLYLSQEYKQVGDGMDEVGVEYEETEGEMMVELLVEKAEEELVGLKLQQSDEEDRNKREGEGQVNNYPDDQSFSIRRHPLAYVAVSGILTQREVGRLRGYVDCGHN